MPPESLSARPQTFLASSEPPGSLSITCVNGVIEGKEVLHFSTPLINVQLAIDHNSFVNSSRGQVLYRKPLPDEAPCLVLWHLFH